jgi:hypothetical protein
MQLISIIEQVNWTKRVSHESAAIVGPKGLMLVPGMQGEGVRSTVMFVRNPFRWAQTLFIGLTSKRGFVVVVC